MLKIELENNDMCFGCGEKNRCGLKLKPIYKYDHTECKIIFDRIYQGWKNIVHGGIISTVMDESMFFELQRNKYYGVTYSLNVKFKKPILIGKEYVCKSHLTRKKGRLLYLSSFIINDSNEEMAIAKAIFYEISVEKQKS